MTSVNDLRSLADSYPAKDGTALAELAGRNERRHQREILELAAIAADVTADSILNLGLEPEGNPLLMEAFRRQYPNVDPQSLGGASAESVSGWVNGVKGKYFEVLVAERLNSGERVGELTLGPGQEARLSDLPTEEGWDLEIVNSDDGSTVELLQFKATNSMAYVKSALTKYPDIKVATTSEIDGVADEILQTDVSDAEIEEVTRRYVGELSEGDVADMLDQSAEWAFDSLPLIPAVVVAVTEGRHVLAGRSSVEESLQSGARRVGRSVTFSALGATLVALDAGLLSAPVTTASKIMWRRTSNRIEMGDFLELKAREIEALVSPRMRRDGGR